ncbi:PREDICTED: zymogen granule protein 16 homolog B [Elephantulus edwardii]|uniref:zymogen granule protein 16 homolog B n=1 Tax=Elephantulus edwardii TaxID=28737 RepID=UPI0003F09704|nr:PREDICTED: zymogen granule protein 16 homolog B [Elephantulus edwardii]
MRRPEAMLLVLTFATLGISTCWAEGLIGNGGGKYFETPKDYENDISAVEICVANKIIKSLRMKTGPSWGKTYGAKHGTCTSFVLWPGEHIIAVSGTHKVFINSLYLFTDQNRIAAFGNDSENKFIIYPDRAEEVLTGFKGMYKLLGITALGCKWQYPVLLEVNQEVYDSNSTSLEEPYGFQEQVDQGKDFPTEKQARRQEGHWAKLRFGPLWNSLNAALMLAPKSCCCCPASVSPWVRLRLRAPSALQYQQGALMGFRCWPALQLPPVLQGQQLPLVHQRP